MKDSAGVSSTINWETMMCGFLKIENKYRYLLAKVELSIHPSIFQ
jgi:hypothetical protein